ncbi:DUF4136 domain-containing protein [Lysobacter terrae]
MKRLAFAATVAMMLAACASTPDVQTDFDPAAQFGLYRTYTWAATPEFGDPLMQQRITTSIDGKLGAMGWTPAPAATADAVITAHVITREQLSIDTFNSGGWGGWGPPGRGSASVRSYTVGTLVLDILDARTKRAVWRGTASGALPKTSYKAAAKTQAAIDRMFASFPGATTKR